MTITAEGIREWPLLMRGDLVRATIEGRKTQTRRVPVGRWKNLKVGDRLWIRETWARLCKDADGCDCAYGEPHVSQHTFEYRADSNDRYPGGWPDDDDYKGERPTWRPSIFMPRAACRLVLEVTAHRVERLQQITEQDANDEGIQFDGRFWLGAPHPTKGTPKVFHKARSAFMDGWNHLNADRGYGWDHNPEVTVITYRITQ